MEKQRQKEFLTTWECLNCKKSSQHLPLDGHVWFIESPINKKTFVRDCSDYWDLNIIQISKTKSNNNIVLLMEDREWEQQWKIINNYWTRLSKISWFVCGEQINICRSRRLSEIIDLHDKQLLFYHSITEFVLFNEYPGEAKRSAIFKQEWSQEGEKHGFLYACAEYYLQPNTVGRHCPWADHYL